MESLQSSAGSAETGSKAMVFSNFLINLALSSSLNLLWSMVNTLQIIVHMPLMNIAMPLNAYVVSKILVSVASFDVIPTDLIYEYVFNFDEEAESSGTRYEMVGMESNNFIINAGTLFWLILGWVFAVIFVFMLNLLGKVCTKV